MFFIMGITEGRKDFDFSQTITCSLCGRYGIYTVFMTYMVLSLFFIPCIKWNRHYYVQTSCCNTVYELDPEKGKQIARGESVEILNSDLKRADGRHYGNTYKACGYCGYTTDEDFRYCPKCGREL